MFHYLVSSKHSNRLPNISCIITLVLFSASVTSVSIFGTAKTALIENTESNLNSSTNQVLIMHIIHMLLHKFVCIHVLNFTCVSDTYRYSLSHKSTTKTHKNLVH